VGQAREFFSCASRGSNPRPGGFRFRTPTSRASARSLWLQEIRCVYLSERDDEALSGVV